MPNANYLKGRNFEYKVKKYLEQQGYVVLRTAGSHGIYDLIAIKFEPEPSIIFIQCKARLGSSTKEKLGRFEVYESLVYRNTYKQVL
ncbi:MAG: restriction endonuclease [Candidatus Nitrosocaldaceae archaeon]